MTTLTTASNKVCGVYCIRIQANKFSDPVTGEDVILLISTDITQRVAAEKQLQQVLNAEHKLLEGIFPKQVLQALTKSAIRNHIQNGAGGNSVTGEASFSSAYQAINASKIKLALKHEQVRLAGMLKYHWYTFTL